MNTLGDVQGLFYRGIVHKETAAVELIEGQGALNAVERLEIYAEGYRLRLLEALGDTYPAVHTLLGDDAFDQLGRAYIDAHPSTHFSIRYFGHRFSAFVQGYSDISANARALVAEMAQFEWSLRAAFDAEDHVAVGLSELADFAANAWPRLCFKFAPSLQCQTMQWNTPSLWLAIEAGQGPQAVQRLDDPEPWIIWRRQDLQTRFRSLSADEGMAIDTIHQGRNFAEMCAVLGDDAADSAQRAAGYLQGWLTENLIAAVHFAD